MDTNDVSNLPQYVQALRDQQQKLQDAQTRKGQRPARKPRNQVILQFQLKLMASRSQAAAQGPQLSHMRTSFVPPPYPPCAVPLANLQKIMIDDLLLETHHRGAYLLVRSVTPQDLMTAVMAIVEDEQGDVLMVQLYHQETDAGGPDPAEDILVEGTALVIKEPYLKVMADGNYGIRVDHLSDVVFLSADDERIPYSWGRGAAELTALAWKTKGNNQFNKAAYRSAIECYTQALACSPTPHETQTIRLNRSLVFLRTRQYDAALLDAESAIMTATASGKPVEKALFRKAEALYSLERYRDCCEVLKELRLEYPDNLAAKDRLTRAVSRLAEQTSGKYSFQQLHAEAAKIRPPHLDYATYIGPVSVRASGSRGRGLFTTKAVKAGDLLFCEKASTHAFVDRKGGRGCGITMLIDSENGGTLGAQSDLISMTVQKLYRNPSLVPLVTSLHHGSYQPVEATEADGKPVVDTFLIRRIIALNSFGCPLSTLTSHNQHHNHTRLNPATNSKPDPGSDGHPSCGLWPLLASYINHSCASTARRAFIGDMMIARATRDLPADTEVTWWYQVPAAGNYKQRRGKLRQNWGFVCDCAMCEDERGTGEEVLTKRRALGRSVASLGQGQGQGRQKGDEIVTKIEAAMDAMAATYSRSASEVPRLAIWEAVQKALVRMQGTKQLRDVQPMRMMKLFLEAFKALGYVIEGGLGGTIIVRQWGLMVDGVVAAWMFLRDVYRVAAPELVAPAEKYARTAYRMVFGEDETFDMYGNA